MTPIYFPGWDKVAHLIEYGILGFLSQQAARVTWPDGWGGSWPVRTPSRILLRMIIILFAGICIGALDEMIQAGIFWERSTERIASVTDFGADTAGLVLGALLNVRRYRSRSELKERTP
jgi:VanZ family protein